MVTRDEHTIGALHTVAIDGDGKPTEIVVATGLLHHDHRTIPIAQVHAADGELNVLTITRAAYGAAPE